MWTTRAVGDATVHEHVDGGLWDAYDQSPYAEFRLRGYCHGI